jgi:hypothetical protein
VGPAKEFAALLRTGAVERGIQPALACGAAG